MSYMILTCHWCGESYDFGVVGHTVIGSGHQCQVRDTCDTEGCREVGKFLVAADSALELREFSCAEHIGSRTLLAAQAT